jgi:alpha-L-fucosidase
MRVNREAIYGTRPIAPFKDGKVCLTQKKDDGAVYAIYLADPDEDRPPKIVRLDGLMPASDAKIVLLGMYEELRWRKEGKGVAIEIPEGIRQQPPNKYAWAIRVSKTE